MMITCKEDLINTYIEKGNPILTNAYLNACAPYIDVHLCRSDKFPEDSHFYFNPSVKHLQSGECDTERYKKLTLSDLKPHTKQYAVLYKGGSYSFQSDKPVGDNVVACFDLSHSEAPLSGDFFDEKPRTKVEYVKTDVDSRGQALDAFDNEIELFKLVDGEYSRVTAQLDAISNWRNLYERIETPMTEREAFIELMGDFLECKEYKIELGNAFDSGKFKLVN